ncbi:MAG TPA: aminoacyl--tRNA ligase-related protein [Candidatus Saccharimonadales bacterium]|nr:aminoacyl--tRNA ligase-related protein [Candidatus Saccharimonadales bacterium]
MRVSQLFTKTSKTVPADETAKNAQLLIQAGLINKEMAGVYTYLPLGKRILDNIVQVIREEMDAVGGNEISLTALQNSAPWEKSGRWSDEAMDVWFRTKLAGGTELGLAPTHEEPLTQLMTRFISSYKDLPAYPYQFQVKFRNELRSKSGLMRGREFLMKDLYSFSRDQAEHDEFYERISTAYHRVFERLGIGSITYKTFASGGSFSKYSHEYQTLSEVGEDIIYVHEGKGLAINKEVYTDEVLQDLGVSRDELVEKKAVEVGNIFTLGTRFSEPLELTFTDEDGTVKPVVMGSYGIGPSRLMGLLAEHFADDRGLVWPEAVAPAKVYLARLGATPEVVVAADELYKDLTSKSITVLYDDREDARPGEKFADADLIGLPYRVVISDKTLANNTYEVKARTSDTAEHLSRQELMHRLGA